MSGLMFADAHAHFSPKGLGAFNIAKKFKEKNGWFIAFIALSPWHYGINITPRTAFDAYIRSIEIFLKGCAEARQAGIRVSCLAGFHPADVDKLISIGMAPEEVLDVGIKVVEYEVELCEKGIINGIGEVGRQHYKTMPERLAIASTIMLRAFELVSGGCRIHLHLENSGAATVKTVEKLVELAKAPRHLILFHHASTRVADIATQSGFWATLPGKKELLRKALQQIRRIDRVLIESDYIDDPKRPCVSSCPWEIVDNQLALLQEGIIDEEVVAKINIDNIIAFYDVEAPS
ncbi:TatD family hydrolase [Pyrofollis japonicus]|uniref:TatD family hydrolase n=1 Tax=Pyrofollis japonicus TaxID=3060460 RepID=UPI00295C3A97|nr:TatD family hydrolase [Pyrofollis japonicus]